MQGSGSFGGNIGPFLDPGTGLSVPATAHGTFVVNAVQPVDINAALPNASAAILAALTQVITAKLAANQVAIATIQGSLPYFQQEIAQAAGLERLGLQLVQLNATVTPAPQAPAIAPYTGPMPPSPQEATANAFKQAAADRLDPRNYEVKASVNIGGIKIKGSSASGIDTDSITNQIANKAKSTVIWWGIGCAVLALVVAIVAALAFYILYAANQSAPGATPSATATAATWDGKSTFSCGGNQHLKLKGITANLASGTAINAGANCQLDLEDVNITAPVCISAGANAKVTVKGGSVNGSQFAAQALGTSQITFSGTKITGNRNALGGKIIGP